MLYVCECLNVSLHSTGPGHASIVAAEINREIWAAHDSILRYKVDDFLARSESVLARCTANKCSWLVCEIRLPGLCFELRDFVTVR
jgi:hypothetical protein